MVCERSSISRDEKEVLTDCGRISREASIMKVAFVAPPRIPHPRIRKDCRRRSAKAGEGQQSCRRPACCRSNSNERGEDSHGMWRTVWSLCKADVEVDVDICGEAAVP